MNDKSGIGQTLVNLAAVYQSQANYPEALDFLQQALAILREEKERYGEAVILNNMGEIYRGLGQARHALSYFEKARSLFDAEGDKFAVGIAVANIGAAYDALGEYSQALEFYQEAVAIATAVEDAVGIGQTLLNMGAVYEKLAEYSQALESYQQGLEVMRAVGDLDAIAQALNNIGSVHRLRGDYSQALQFYDRALEIRQNIGNRAGIAVTLNNQGVALVEAGKIPEAIDTLYAAIDALESLRPGLSDRNKISIFDKYRSSYSVLQKALLAQNQIETALEVSERGRARAFVELIARRVSPEAAQEYANERISSPTIAEIKQVAGAQNATLVEYSIAIDNKGENSQLLIWVVKPTGEIHARQVELSSLEQYRDNLVPFLVRGEPDGNSDSLLTALVRGTRADLAEPLLSIPADRVSSVKLKKLPQLLIKPIADVLPKNPEERVIFVPHNELFFVPFPALQDEAGRYLIENHTILTAPAIQVLQLIAQEATGDRATGEALVVGNPVMPVVSRQPGEEAQTFDKLPGAEQEAIAVGALLNTEPLIGSEVTETRVLQRISTADRVHLATHGLLDDYSTSGIPGAIVLAPGDAADGLLTAEEIMALNLNASLVVLSACNTGGGNITGDGIVGLSRALLGAGAKSAIVTLWKVEDAPTAQFMPDFYRFLAQTGDRAVALRQAMLATMQQHPNPRYWAAFTLIGESRSRR
ncbi:CHAT domain-containing tetratricopeptide repeat protein [Phormidium sp. CCY1219]|nr:CHAT domain-containing tetratricopeptide repeat protein [Phormidium sp. CCY1219]